MLGQIELKYIKTTKATKWPIKSKEPSLLLNLLMKIFPSPNRSNELKFHLLSYWLIEFDDTGEPISEIGVDEDDVPLFKSDVEDGTFGYWLDTNMMYKDFSGSEDSEITVHQFNNVLNKLNLK